MSDEEGKPKAIDGAFELKKAPNWKAPPTPSEPRNASPLRVRQEQSWLRGPALTRSEAERIGYPQEEIDEYFGKKEGS